MCKIIFVIFGGHLVAILFFLLPACTPSLPPSIVSPHMKDNSISFTPKSECPCRSAAMAATSSSTSTTAADSGMTVRSLVDSSSGVRRPLKIKGPMRRPSFEKLYGK